ncbi:uncharacterized protein Triagg1_2502 [Trichoderma aggressivum f. europaeum]|uniref:RING-type domain-containing protein n=1 Tax=Trichoderma aggressivum f. europaeum TaxID=173218 RepID=A0AAE1JBV6_9HYPO|nr:hypothetical protein Triagg1_2502 [Trichoderma aggressivum f. europaeum]
MRLESSRDPGPATVRSGRRKLRPGEPSDWNQKANDAAPQPHTRGTVQIQRRLDLATAPPPQLTMRRRESNNAKGVDATPTVPATAADAVAAAAAAANGGRSNIPPWQPGLARAASDAYRRPKGTLMDSYDGEDESANEQPSRRTRRNSSPPNHPRRRLMPGAYSEPSTHRSASVSSYGGDEDDDHGLEVEEIPADGSSRHSRHHLSSRDEYLDSSSDRNRYRKRFTPRRYYSDDERDSDPPLSASDVPSTSHTRESSRVRERSMSAHKAQRYQLTHVIEGSRPPVASRKSSNNKLARRATSTGRDGAGYRSAESAYEDRDPRRSFTMRSARSLNGSTSGPARILGNIFGNAASGPISRPASRPASRSRPSSPDKFFKLEKQSKMEKRKGIECVICMEDTPSSKGADLKCGHRMCNACMKRNFEMSIHDPQHMPPRCCTKSHIPLKHVDKLFDNDFKRTWNRNAVVNGSSQPAFIEEKMVEESLAVVVARPKFVQNAADLNIPTEDLRKILRVNRPNSMEELRSYSRPTSSMPATRPKPQVYDEEMHLRRLQEQRDADFARRLQVSDEHEDEYEDDRDHDHDRDRDRNRDRNRDRKRDRDRGRDRDWERERERENPFAPITPEKDEEEVDFGLNSSKHHPMEDYRRTSLPTLPTAASATQPQPPYNSYVSGVNRARGPQRSGSMEQRLADRLSENRPGRQSRGPSPPAPAMRPHVLHPRDATIGHAPDMGVGMALGAMGRGSMPPPPAYAPVPAMPSPGLMRPNPFGGDAYYDNAYTTTPRSVHDPYYYGVETAETELPSPRRRSRRSGDERERPKSSTLAGLTGYGRGAHRVSEWRAFVEPGFPDE